MSYMAIIQWLAGSFNNEGRFVAIVILIFQLVTSGGAYAIELIPKWLQSASHILPMTYSVNGLRNIIDGHQHQMLVNNSWVLLLFIVVALSLSMITFSIKFRHTHKIIRANDYEGTPVE
jgi:putative membrane protein